ncbi:hypothetical protein IAT38_003862 [Cryptococcus sp. DSM 104549]
MARVEDVPDADAPLRQRPSTKSQSKSKSKNKSTSSSTPSDTGSGSTRNHPAIPLAHPSFLPSSKKPAKPLLDVPVPEGFLPRGVKPGEGVTVSSAEELERLGAQLEAERAAAGGGVADDDEDEERGERVEDDEVFSTLIVAVPFTFLFLLLDILVHLQYSHRPSLGGLVKNVITALPTNRHPTHFLTNSLLMSASLLSGCRLIWLVNKASWSVVTAQAPPMGTLWILTIVQLPLSRAVIALASVGAWVWYSGMAIVP